MDRRVCGLIAAMVWAAAAPAHADCKVAKVADLPVTMSGMRPLAPFKINGQSALFMIDSGAFFSMMSKAGADRLKLEPTPLPPQFHVSGIGGDAYVQVARVKTFGIAGQVIREVDFLVGGSDLLGSGAVGVVGQNVLRAFDVEYDLADGAIRLMDAHGCDRTAMAYWAGDKAIGMETLRWADAADPHTRGEVMVNKVRLTAMFDTGASTSVLSLAAAKRAGIRIDGPGVEPAGFSSGVGRQIVRSWLAPVKTFGIGGEEVRHTRLRIADTELDQADMLIGADFFLSHRVYVATSRRLMFFTYNGGPVFDLSKHEAATTNAGATDAALQPSTGASGDAALDADALTRRAAASAARGDLAAADVDLTHAIAKDPKNVAALRERALVRFRQHRPLLGRSDVNAALELAPDDIEALTLRAELRLEEGDRTGAAADLDAAAKARPDAGRLDFANLYTRLDRFPEAVAQYDRWIALHPEDAALPEARNGRCWARALGSIALDKALVDCNAAIRARPRAAQFLDSRGLVRLRRGEYPLAVNDYDAALSIDPRSAWSLYGRGVAETKIGRDKEGAVNMAAAAALAPKAVERAKALCIRP